MKASRKLSRRFALQGIYAWQLSGQDPVEIAAHLREDEEFSKADEAFFLRLFHGVTESVASLDPRLAAHVDRPIAELSPVELAVLRLGVFELAECVDVPYRVVINEAVELAKQFGGTDGHKYVNGVLDKLAKELRAAEIEYAKKSAQ